MAVNSICQKTKGYFGIQFIGVYMGTGKRMQFQHPKTNQGRFVKFSHFASFVKYMEIYTTFFNTLYNLSHNGLRHRDLTGFHFQHRRQIPQQTFRLLKLSFDCQLIKMFKCRKIPGVI
jgi:hypothetical protein